ncbi:MAG: stalk domain-containing protein [Tissierellia bacterium]|nr:stalk domain-containing protein [Tissierellia bacterium]MDD4047011.1 stalk domain-containing protein [Tissierellia bacterium]MDD4679073.1 stalk domain-containing protein [Tissierellia bacterium]
MKTVKTILTAIIILMMIFTLNVYGLSYEASNHYELENIILEQMKEYNPDFNIKYTGSLDNIKEVLANLVNKDIYLKSNFSEVKWDISGTNAVSYINVKVTYIITAEERIKADKIIDSILADIIKPYMNNHEKVKAVHDYIVLNGKYDANKIYYSDYDLLTEGTSVCNGYALLTYNMLNKLNIPVNLVYGTAAGEDHIWNMVKLGDYWFHLDTTWNDPSSDVGTVLYSYYMLTEKEITKDHIIDENLEIPKSTKNYYDYLKELSYEKLLAETGLDMYNAENTAKNESELINILKRKIMHRPLSISIRFDKSISQSSLENAMSQLAVNSYIFRIEYSLITSDTTGEYNVLNSFIKYREAPEKIVLEFGRDVYNIATEVKFNVYAMYGNKKVNITNDVYIYPYDANKIDISKGTLKFKEPGNYNLLFEFQGLRETISITGLNSNAFNYITDKRPDNYVNVKVYDQYIDFSSINQWPIIENDRTMVPLRAVFEVLNCNVKWEESSKSAVVEYGSTKIIIPANSTTAYINGKANSLDVPAKIVNDRIMIPLRFVSEAIEKTVIWDDADKTVLIY